MRLTFFLALALLYPAHTLLAQNPGGVTQPQGERRVINRQVYDRPPAFLQDGQYRVIRRTTTRPGANDQSTQPTRQSQPQPSRPAQSAVQRAQPVQATPETRPQPIELSRPAVTPRAQPQQDKETSTLERIKGMITDANYFVGAGFGYTMRNRQVVLTDGAQEHKFTTKENEFSPAAELGALSGGAKYYGAKLSLYDGFVEFSGFGGIAMDSVSYKGFTPFVQAMAGMGYSNLSGILPNNFTLGLATGVNRALLSDRLYFHAQLSYQHRFWQSYKNPNGSMQDWHDQEITFIGGVRYPF